MEYQNNSRIVRRIAVIEARQVRATSGSAPGDGLGRAQALDLGSEFRLLPGAARVPAALTVDAAGRNGLRLAAPEGPTEVPIRVEAALTFLGGDTGAAEALLLCETGFCATGRWLLPLGPLRPGTGYTLAAVDGDGVAARFAELAAPAFAAGTRIARDTGELVPVERLKQGDGLLTRDGGTQRIRWIGRSAHRAWGPHAPVRIAAGTLWNERDLVVGAAQRIFVYRRGAVPGPRAEAVVRAENLINGTSVRREAGGFVQYHRILLDAPEVIYAEGIGCESLYPGPLAEGLLPANLHILLPKSARPVAPPAVELVPRPGERATLAERLRGAARG